MIDYSYVRYLRAKQSIDDRSINRQVMGALSSGLAAHTGPLRVLEIGAGVGVMASRLVDWGVIDRKTEYTLLDRDAASMAAAREHLEGWATRATRRGPALLAEKNGVELDLRLELDDFVAFASNAEHRGRYDLVVANAVLDLFDLGPTLPLIWQMLAGGGQFWFTVNFDGETIFLPELALDRSVIDAYHASMGADAGATRGGHSQTGRRLLEAIPASGAELLAAGSSDWVVFPRQQTYAGDEAYFLHHIVHTIEGGVAGSPGLSTGEFEAWARARHEQIERGELIYIAHQLDVLGRRR
jgi:hypothetical protein